MPPIPSSRTIVYRPNASPIVSGPVSAPAGDGFDGGAEVDLAGV
jgi:hypothetical protein